MAHNDRAAARLSIADQLEGPRDALDLLIRDARLPPHGRHDLLHHDLEERAQAIVASIIAPFRGRRRPIAPPIALASDGDTSSAWF